MQEIQNLLIRMKDSTSGQSFKSMTPEEKIRFLCESENAKEGTLHLDDGYDCPICKNKGYTITPAQVGGYWRELYKSCSCMNVRANIAEFHRSGLGDLAKRYTLENFETTEDWQKQVLKAAVNYINDPTGNWFFIGGQTGAGKSHICTAICKRLIAKGWGLHYMEWEDEATRIKAVTNDPTIYPNMIDRLQNVSVLYIDDLFKTGRGPDGEPLRPTGADIKLAFKVLNNRYRQPNKLTIISSELTLSDITAIDEAVAGRIAERSAEGGYCINLKKDLKKNYRFRNMHEL